MRALLIRDLTVALRSGSGILLGLVFYLVLVTLFLLALGSDAALIDLAAPATLWIGALLSMLLSFDRVLALDHEDGSLDLLRTSGVPALTIVYAKLAVLWLTAGVPLILISPLLSLLMGVKPGLFLVPSLALGTLGLAALGTFGAALVISLKRGALILPVLVLPLTIPSVIFGTLTLAREVGPGDPLPTFALLAGINLMTLVLAPLATARALSSG